MIDITQVFSQVANVLLFNEKNQALLIMRNDLPYWELVGGMVDPGENFEEAALREAQEEIGRDLVLGRPIADFYKRSPIHEDKYSQMRYFHATFADEKPIAVDEHVAFEWFDLNALPMNMGYLHREILLSARNGTVVDKIIPYWSRVAYTNALKPEQIYGLEMWKKSPKVAAKRAAGGVQYDPL